MITTPLSIAPSVDGQFYMLDGDGRTVAIVERETDAQFLADMATVVQHPRLWGLGPGFEAAPSIAMVWLEQGGLPVPFEGATLREALHNAAEHIRKAGGK